MERAIIRNDSAYRTQVMSQMGRNANSTPKHEPQAIGSDIARALAAMRPEKDLVCPICGGTFTGRGRRVYCGPACRTRAYRERLAGREEAPSKETPQISDFRRKQIIRRLLIDHSHHLIRESARLNEMAMRRCTSWSRRQASRS
jgi:hypothetical protein